MTTWEDVHAGAVVLGHDGQTWGVAGVAPGPDGPTVALVRHGQQLVGRPPAGTPITVIQPADVSGELAAVDALLAGGLGPVEIVYENWEV